MWFHTRRTMKGPRGGTTMVFQKRNHDGSTAESTCQGKTESMIFEETEIRFQLAMDAPISSTELIKKLGNLADTEIAQQIVEGTFDSPDEMDEAQ